MNDILENALKETWEKKDKFYEKNKDLSILEILMKLENKYGAWDTSHNQTVYVPAHEVDRTPLRRLRVTVKT